MFIHQCINESTGNYTFLNNFAERLSGLIVKPLTQQAIADAMGVSQPTIQRWMKGDAEPGMEDLLKLATLFKLDPYALVYSDRPVPAPMLLREGPSERKVDAAMDAMNALKEKVKELDAAMQDLKSKSIAPPNSKATYDARRGGVKASASAKPDPSE